MLKFTALFIFLQLIIMNGVNGHFWSKFKAAIEARNSRMDSEIEIPFKNLKEGVLNEFPSLVTDIVDATNLLNELCLKHKFSVPIHRKPTMKDTTFILMTSDQNYSYPMEYADLIVENPAFNPNWNTIIFSAGWETSFNGTNTALCSVYNAYKWRGNHNFIAINTNYHLDYIVYPWAALNAKTIGNFAGTGLKQLTQVYPLSRIHLIGHSLGAHIVGFAGRNYTHQTGLRLPRITGLDPAKPCFINNPRLLRLRSGDAEFVDVIHTDPAILGIDHHIGDVDFYPNGHHSIPGGCSTLICAHERSWEYYSESVHPGNEYGFMSVQCTSEKDLKDGLCTGQKYPMGFACPSGLEGDMFLETNKIPPYGRNSVSPSKETCL